MKHASLVVLLACAAPTRSPHADALAQNPYDFETMESPLTAARDAGGRPSRVVYGYLPYWVSSTNTVLHWDQMTHLAYFSLDLDASGEWTPESVTRMNGTRFASLRDDAKAHGVKFVVTVCNFHGDQIGVLIGAQRAATVQTIVQMVKDTGAEGVDIDFEFVPKAGAANFVTFMADLTARLHSEVPGSHVTYASPSSSWGGAYDHAGLLAASDGAMIMFYGCHYGKSTIAGPLAPLTAGSEWSSVCNMTAVSQYFLSLGDKDKIIMGLPFYGFQWAVSSTEIGASTTATGSAKVWTSCKSRYATRRNWDDESQTPWTYFTDSGVTYQLWCDDGESLDRKLATIKQFDLAGMGIWALGYEAATTDYWDALRAQFTAVAVSSGVPVVSAPQTSQPGQPITLDGSGNVDSMGRPLTFLWEQKSGPMCTMADPTASITTCTPREAGTYTFWLTITVDGVPSQPAEVVILVGVSAPVEEQPETLNGETEEDVLPKKPRAGVAGEAPTGCSAHGTTLFVWLFAALAVKRRARNFVQ